MTAMLVAGVSTPVQAHCYCQQGVDLGGGQCGIPQPNGPPILINATACVDDGPPPPPEYKHRYVGLAYTKDGKPFLFRKTYIASGYDFTDGNFAQAEAELLQQCDLNSSRNPCHPSGLAATNGACIAVAETDHASYGRMAASCSEAKKEALQGCQTKDPKPDTCKISESKSTDTIFDTKLF